MTVNEQTLGANSEEASVAQLVPWFNFPAKMRRYVLRLRVTSDHFDRCGPAMCEHCESCREEMLRILMSKKIAEPAACRAVDDALDSAARFQFRKARQDQIANLRRQSMTALDKLFAQLQMAEFAILCLPARQRKQLNSIVAARSREFFDADTFNLIIEELIKTLPRLSPRRWANESLEALGPLRALWEVIPGDTRIAVEEQMRIAGPPASAVELFRTLSELLEEHRPRASPGRNLALERLFANEVARIWRRLGLRYGLAHYGDGSRRDTSKFQHFCDLALSAFGDSRRVSRRQVLALKTRDRI